MKTILQKMTLRNQIIASFVLVMMVAMAIIVFAEQVEYDEVRRYMASRILQNKVLDIKVDLARGHIPDLADNYQLYNEMSVPRPLRNYALNFHTVDKQKNQYVFVFDFGDQRYYLEQKGNTNKFVEFVIDSFAPIVICLCLFSAFWIGRMTSVRVTAPITRLADAIQKNKKPFPFQSDSDEIGILARAFAQHSDELEQFLHRERYFVGDTSHELRTPLAIIAGAAETIFYQLPDESHLKNSAERIVRTTQEMQQQLACLLLLSRDPQTLAKNEVALNPIIEQCATRCEPWLAKKPVSLIIEAPNIIFMQTNAELVRSIFWNLIRNACQYTDYGEIRIRLNHTTLEISDTGPGLPNEIDTEQFERFVSTSPNHGEGLGLSIVQRIVDHLGWHMNVESSASGCRFKIILIQ